MDNEAFPIPPPGFRAGFIALVGAPNAGKSTLLNRILGQKISITSQRPQTTRNRILGVHHRDGSQMVFIDTPGVHRARGELNARIVDVALAALNDADLVLVIADAARPDPSAEPFLRRKLQAVRRPRILALNKVDIIRKPQVLKQIAAWSQSGEFAEVVPVSARTGEQVDRLLGVMEARLPAGPPYFPPDTLTDLTERFITAEIVREKVFRLTGQEIPYAAAVTVEDFSRDENGKMVRIHASIHVERGSQKGIVIGKGGERLRQIGEQARADIQRMLDSRVYLKLFVRVQKNWSRDTRALRRFGY